MVGTGDCFNFTIDDMRVAALCDASFDIDKDSLIGEPAEAIDACFPGESTPVSCTTHLVRMRGMTVLVDAGAGDTFDGRMHEALAKTGIVSERIDHILLTYLHLDHIGGILPGGEAVFANAQIWLAEEEYAFWHDDGATSTLAKRLTPSLGEDFIPTHVKVARDALAAYDGRVRLFAGKQTILPGVTSVPLHGHTPGHCGYLLESGEEAFFLWGDAVHIAAVQFALPGAGMIFDWNAALAVEARRHAFATAAAKGLLSAGMHLPFPGAGTVLADGEACRFVPLDVT